MFAWVLLMVYVVTTIIPSIPACGLMLSWALCILRGQCGGSLTGKSCKIPKLCTFFFYPCPIIYAFSQQSLSD